MERKCKAASPPNINADIDLTDAIFQFSSAGVPFLKARQVV